MPGRGTAPRSGNELKQRVVDLARELGLEVKTEVRAARRLWGQKRHIDVVLTEPKTGKRLGIECKFQSTPGTAEEKVPSTIQDIEHWPIPGIVVIDGEGFSENMSGYLMSTGKVVWFEDLEDWLRLYFGL
ncbi:MULTISPECIES: PD-(D/E)XK nuclease superfamily protein [Anaerolinea]|uniref:PD-(D/E)XK nuclease superfamily protein n=1 Tax=Anaerolinea TaxID=233189 RepID=UPI00261C2485|nr:PD-(D/E)XK nuclease superfamily protein [Anaerolinea thermophila]